jgi:hypothetical protein
MRSPLTRRDWLRFSSAALGGLLLTDSSKSLFAVDPAESDLLVRSENPFNAEPPLAQLVAASITPLA